MRMGMRLRLKPDAFRQLVEDLSESWGWGSWERGEEVSVRPPMNDDLREAGWLIVHLTKGQEARLMARVAVAEIEARYDAKALP